MQRGLLKISFSCGWETRLKKYLSSRAREILLKYVLQASSKKTLKALAYVRMVLAGPFVPTFVIQWGARRSAKWSGRLFFGKSETNMGELCGVQTCIWPIQSLYMVLLFFLSSHAWPHLLCLLPTGQHAAISHHMYGPHLLPLLRTVLFYESHWMDPSMRTIFGHKMDIYRVYLWVSVEDAIIPYWGIIAHVEVGYCREVWTMR